MLRASLRLQAKCSVIGVGQIGTAVAQGLLRNGHEVTVFDMSTKNKEVLVKQGATWADSLKAIIPPGTEKVITALPAPAHVMAMRPAHYSFALNYSPQARMKCWPGRGMPAPCVPLPDQSSRQRLCSKDSNLTLRQCAEACASHYPACKGIVHNAPESRGRTHTGCWLKASLLQSSRDPSHWHSTSCRRGGSWGSRG